MDKLLTLLFTALLKYLEEHPEQLVKLIEVEVGKLIAAAQAQKGSS